ncbi:hypothetical protein DPMN_148578 [Dreissena polymorpha]|uniref:Uncharacterized protein n=1 Tax=Dreissena polymorpha TaxID=45954 RepID=A0A9D4J447_DREPO|nr:hypothetical protein DPMN_148578 [Dreissena polymorpha]
MLKNYSHFVNVCVSFKGLASAVPILLSENHNVDKLASSVSDDGTTTLNATVSDFDGDELKIRYVWNTTANDVNGDKMRIMYNTNTSVYGYDGGKTENQELWNITIMSLTARS